MNDMTISSVRIEKLIWWLELPDSWEIRKSPGIKRLVLCPVITYTLQRRNSRTTIFFNKVTTPLRPRSSQAKHAECNLFSIVRPTVRVGLQLLS